MRGALVAVVGAVLIWGANTLILQLYSVLRLRGLALGTLVGYTPSAAFWSVLLYAIVGPLADEIFFRGFLYAGLRNRFGVAWGLVLGAVLFGLFRFPLTLMVPLAVMGAILAAMYEISGSLWPGIMARAVLAVIFIATAY